MSEPIVRDKKVESWIRKQGESATFEIAEFIDSLELDDAPFKGYSTRIYLTIFVYAYYDGLNCTELLSEEIHNNIPLRWLINEADPSFDNLQDYREANEEKIRQVLKDFRAYAFSIHMLRYSDILFKGYRKPSCSTRADKLPHESTDDDVDLLLRDFSYNDRYEHPVKRRNLEDATVDDFLSWLEQMRVATEEEDREAERDRPIIEAKRKK